MTLDASEISGTSCKQQVLQVKPTCSLSPPSAEICRTTSFIYKPLTEYKYVLCCSEGLVSVRKRS